METWIVYYADGSSFSSEDGSPHDAPRTGVQVVVTYSSKVGKLPWFGSDYYCWRGDTWVPHDLGGLHDYLAERRQHVVLRGYAIQPAEFQRIYDLAVSDPRMPWKPRERTPEEPLHFYEPELG